MKTTKRILILVLVVTLLHSCSTGKKSYGNCPTTNKNFFFEQIKAKPYQYRGK